MTENTITEAETVEPMTAKEAKAQAKAAKAHAKALRPWYKKPSRVIPLGLVGLMAASIALSGGGESTTAPSTADTVAAATTEKTTDESAAEQVTETATAGIGDAVRDGKFEFTVTDVRDGVDSVGSEYLNETAQGAYTLVTLTVENIGDEPQMFHDSNVTGIDSKGRELASDTGAGIYANENGEGFLTDINPGNSVSAVVVFDVAKGQTLDQIMVKDSAFSGGATITLK